MFKHYCSQTLIAGLLLCALASIPANAQTSTIFTIPLLQSSRSVTDDLSHGNGAPKSTVDGIVDLGDSRLFSGSLDSLFPFQLTPTTRASIQSAAHVSLQIFIRGCSDHSDPVLNLYGYSKQASGTSDSPGDDSASTLLSSIRISECSRSGWLSVDVTKFAIRQSDAGSDALVFRVGLGAVAHGATFSPRKWDFQVAALGARPATLIVTHTDADKSSFDNKVLAGYQGWFRTPGDGTGRDTWFHWFTGNPITTGENFDSWPDMSEYTTAEQTAVPGFTYPDGTAATLYSGQNARTVLRHFQWMENEGIDGIMLSQFGNYLPGGSGYLKDSTTYAPIQKIMDNVVAASSQTGRIWAVEYDGSGMDPSTMYNVLTTQWKYMVDNGYTDNTKTNGANYLHQGGLPVVELYGFFPANSNQPLGDPNNGNPLLAFFETPGPYQAVVVGSGAWNYNTGSTNYLAMLNKLYAYIPWNVGHVHIDSTSGNVVAEVASWPSDNSYFASNGVRFVPLVFPGTAPAGPPVQPEPEPRRGGNFLWEQFQGASAIGGINTIYVAMFDEVNEGTQIMPITATPPTQSPFYTYGSDPGDWYERLVVQGETMLRNGTPITSTIPIQP